MNHIRLRKNDLCVENISAIKLAKIYKTPFYCYSLGQLQDNYQAFKDAFKNINPLICFSVKSNSNLKLLNELKKTTGIGAILNTSFNIHKKTIVETIDDAIKVLKTTNLDGVIINDYYVSK